MTDLQIEEWPLERLLPYAANARTHPDFQVAQIADSIRQFGFNVPCLVDDKGQLIAGHGRLLAAKRLGLTDVPVIVLGHLTEAQARAYRLADNRIALSSGWDADLLAAELKRIAEEDAIDPRLLGFEDDEIAALLNPGNGGLTDPDDVPKVEEATTRKGDVWLLGRHRLVCGDATNADDVALALAGVTPHLMVTDPPYGVDYDPDWRNRASRDGNLVHTIGATAIGRVTNDDRADWREAWALFPGDVAYIWHADKKAADVAASLAASGFVLRAQIIWRKSRTIIGRGDYHYNHEPAWYVVRAGRTGHWSGRRDQGTVWDIAHDPNTTGHGTQKPVECMRRPMENNSSPGQAVYDPFVGSGTTIIAAEMAGRACHALELEPGYCDVSVVRWQNFTGKEARLASSGRPFNEAKDRPPTYEEMWRRPLAETNPEFKG